MRPRFPFRKDRRRACVAVLGAAALIGTAAPVLACAISLPSCTSTSNGRMSQLYINPPGDAPVSLFFEYDAGGARPDTMALVECTSRKGVQIRLPDAPEDWLPPAEVLDYLTEVATSDTSYTLPQIRAGLRSLGNDSRMITLPAGHCGCTLPKMETLGCGDNGP